MNKVLLVLFAITGALLAFMLTTQSQIAIAFSSASSQVGVINRPALLVTTDCKLPNNLTMLGNYSRVNNTISVCNLGLENNKTLKFYEAVIKHEYAHMLTSDKHDLMFELKCKELGSTLCGGVVNYPSWMPNKFKYTE